MVLKFSLTGEGTVRHAQAPDVLLLEWHGGPDLRSFYEACWQAHQSGESTLLVADLNGFPIGQVLIVWKGKDSHPHFPDLQSLRVHPAFRSMGVGSKLLKAAEESVAARGFSQAGLSVGLENVHAQRLYSRLGYHPTGVVYDDHWSYIDASGREMPQVERVMDLVKQLSAQ
jgi:ribosomal protein S18 acetylase RimI-like enzyme